MRSFANSDPRSRATLARARAAALLALTVSLTLAACDLVESDSVTATVRTGPLPVLAVAVDTDMFTDDWLALIYLASEPGVDIRAVTVDSAAPVGCEAGVAIARDLLASVGKTGVPVACGPQPRPGGIAYPAAWADEQSEVATSLGWTAADGDPPGTPPQAGDAVALLRAAIEGGPVTIISLGPATNVARLLEDPTWDRRGLDRIVQMGGAVDAPGTADGMPNVEWNAAVDPAAMAAVIASDVDVLLVSLDGTNSVPIRTADIDRLTADQSTPAARLAARIFDSQREFARSGGYYLWDSLTAMAARQPDVLRVVPIPVRVSLDPGEAGRTVRDPAGHEIDVAVEADADGVERIFLDAILGRAR